MQETARGVVSDHEFEGFERMSGARSSRMLDRTSRHKGLEHADLKAWLARAREHLRRAQLESTHALVAAVDARDSYTRAHSHTVAAYSDAIGRRLELSAATLETLRAAALLHDVGKIGVPDAILTKPGPLTAEEFDVVKRHPLTALEILHDVSFLAEVRPLIRHHHERFDGGGYPDGLSGDAIPIGARILAVADALDTMLSPRIYKEAFSLDRARRELRAGSGSQFDPDVATMALRLLDEDPCFFSGSQAGNAGTDFQAHSGSKVGREFAKPS